MTNRCFLRCPVWDQSTHHFPNHKKHPDRFKTWVEAIGRKLKTEEDYEFFRTKRICHIHFIPMYCYNYRRLSPFAVPTLYLTKESIDEYWSKDLELRKSMLQSNTPHNEAETQKDTAETNHEESVIGVPEEKTPSNITKSLLQSDVQKSLVNLLIADVLEGENENNANVQKHKMIDPSPVESYVPKPVADIIIEYVSTTDEGSVQKLSIKHLPRDITISEEVDNLPTEPAFIHDISVNTTLLETCAEEIKINFDSVQKCIQQPKKKPRKKSRDVCWSKDLELRKSMLQSNSSQGEADTQKDATETNHEESVIGVLEEETPSNNTQRLLQSDVQKSLVNLLIADVLEGENENNANVQKHKMIDPSPVESYVPKPKPVADIIIDYVSTTDEGSVQKLSIKHLPRDITISEEVDNLPTEPAFIHDISVNTTLLETCAEEIKINFDSVQKCSQQPKKKPRKKSRDVCWSKDLELRKSMLQSNSSQGEADTQKDATETNHEESVIGVLEEETPSNNTQRLLQSDVQKSLVNLLIADVLEGENENNANVQKHKMIDPSPVESYVPKPVADIIIDYVSTTDEGSVQKLSMKHLPRDITISEEVENLPTEPAFIHDISVNTTLLETCAEEIKINFNSVQKCIQQPKKKRRSKYGGLSWKLALRIPMEHNYSKASIVAPTSHISSNGVHPKKTIVTLKRQVKELRRKLKFYKQKCKDLLHMNQEQVTKQIKSKKIANILQNGQSHKKSYKNIITYSKLKNVGSSVGLPRNV